MRDSAAIAVKNGFFCFMQFPIMIEHKEFSGIPAKMIDILIRRSFHKWFVYKYIDCVYAAFVCVFFQVRCNFFPDFRLDKVKYSAAENNVMVFGYTIIFCVLVSTFFNHFFAVSMVMLLFICNVIM